MRADDTRARIFAAAVRLFAEHGYFDTTVDRIVREAGVAKGTFFVHFATKDALVTELVRNQVRAARRTRDRTLAAGGSAVDAMRATVMALGQQAAADRGLSRCVVSANLANPMLGGYAESVFGGVTAEMMDDVRAAQRAGLLTSDVDAETIAGSLITVYFGATLHFATAPHSRPLLELLEPVLDANLNGFRGPAASAAPLAAAPAARAARPRPSRVTKVRAPAAKKRARAAPKPR
jgi:AcrR family transcriptional regulator